MSKIKKFSFTTITMFALLSGIIIGILIHGLPLGSSSSYVKDVILIDGIFLVLGSGFVKLMKMLVIPLVFTSLVSGVMSIGDTKKLSKIGGKTVVFYLITTAIAIIIALVIANVVNPGIGLNISNIEVAEVTVSNKESFAKTLLNIIPSNPISSMANGEIIPIIIFSLFIGIALSNLGTKAVVVSSFFKQFNDVVMEITAMVLKFAPIGVFCLVARTFSTLGASAILNLAKYVGGVYIALAVQICIYLFLLYIFTKINPIHFVRKFFNVMMFAFSTASSNTTIPLNIEVLEKKIGVPRKISSFTIPLGATINMDGTAIMQGVAVVFAAQAFGVQLSAADYITVITTATLASIGTAGVPGVGLIMLSMVLSSVGLPIEAIGLIMGVDRIVDMARTSVNITGDAVCTTIITAQENELNKKVFNS